MLTDVTVVSVLLWFNPSKTHAYFNYIQRAIQRRYLLVLTTIGFERVSL